MYDTRDDVLVGLRCTPAVLRQAIAQPEIESGTGWNRTEVIWHLRDAEARALERMRAMRDQERPALAAYDQEALAREGRYRERDSLHGVREFTLLRQTMIGELEALRPEQWERVGIHEEVGPITILNQAIHLVGHDLNHLAQLAASPRSSIAT